MIATMFDSGAGNLHSLAKALRRCGLDVVVEPDPYECARADLLVLPGVGAFGAATTAIGPALAELRAAVADGLPVVGVCLGAQLLFDSSAEGPGAGLGVIAGRVERLRSACVPHMGWNRVVPVSGEPLLAGIAEAYFAHSFVCRPLDPSVVVAWAEHEEERVPAVLRAGRVVGIQFHPEKSSTAGLNFLRRVIEEVTQ